MDYKYIEQLLERYWECQTTLEEEAILRTFFRQEDVPASLLPYRALFIEEDEMAAEHLGKDFREKMLRLVGEDAPAQVCKARRVTFMRRLRPFYRAAGLVAILLTIGNAAHQSFTDEETPPQTAETIAPDSIQQILMGTPEQQSAELTAQPIDSIGSLTR
ncbi:MAG: pyruvate ferredoxin oxidoreductase [Bacteroidaceae bacterium]|nr:pyruvate ferredoxin oxidoreductase [Bacteroidaceae bacterium]